MMRSNRFGLRVCFGLASLIALCGPTVAAKAAFHLWQIQEVFTNASGSVQFIEMRDTSSGETATNGFKLSADSSGNTQSVTLTNLSKPTPGSLLFATSGFAALPGGVTPDFIIPASFVNPNASSITISFDGSLDAITFPGSSLPHDGLHSLNDTNIYLTPNLVSQNNSPTNLSGNSGSVNVPEPVAFCGWLMTAVLIGSPRRRQRSAR
jgi:serralysin